MTASTKAARDRNAAAALRIVEEFGIERLDAIEPNEARKAQLTVLRHQLMATTGISREAARKHIATACRRLRHGETLPAWGRPAKAE